MPQSDLLIPRPLARALSRAALAGAVLALTACASRVDISPTTAEPNGVGGVSSSKSAAAGGGTGSTGTSASGESGMDGSNARGAGAGTARDGKSGAGADTDTEASRLAGGGPGTGTPLNYDGSSSDSAGAANRGGTGGAGGSNAGGADGNKSGDQAGGAGGTSGGGTTAGAGGAGAGGTGAGGTGAGGTTGAGGAGGAGTAGAGGTGKDGAGAGGTTAGAGGAGGGTGAGGAGAGGAGSADGMSNADAARLARERAEREEAERRGRVETAANRVRIDQDEKLQTLGGALPAVLSMDQQGQFEFDKFELSDDIKSALDLIATRLKEAPYDRLIVQGFTDQIGTPEYNQKLSEKRAWAVAGYLMDKGVPPYKLRVEGKGETKSVTDPDFCKGLRREALIECLQRDRRVEIVATMKEYNLEVQ